MKQIMSSVILLMPPNLSSVYVRGSKQCELRYLPDAVVGSAKPDALTLIRFSCRTLANLSFAFTGVSTTSFAIACIRKHFSGNCGENQAIVFSFGNHFL
jgi:hypothetical protein